MSHLLARESWPADDQPASVVYLCSSMAYGEVDDPADADQPARARRKVQADALRYLARPHRHYLPNSVGDGRLRMGSALRRAAGIRAGGARRPIPGGQRGPVRSLRPGAPGDRSRTPDGRTTRPFRHLHLAGDWTDSGLNAGCIEAAVMSGIQSANSVLGLPRWPGSPASGDEVGDI